MTVHRLLKDPRVLSSGDDKPRDIGSRPAHASARFGARLKLRAEIKSLHQQLADAIAAAVSALGKDENWGRLEEAKQHELLQKHNLITPTEPELGSTGAVVAALNGTVAGAGATDGSRMKAFPNGARWVLKDVTSET